MSLTGHFTLKNDNSKNIFFSDFTDPTAPPLTKAEELKIYGNKLFSEAQFENAIGCYKMAILDLNGKEDVRPHIPEMATLMSNMVQCYLKLELYEHALQFANETLSLLPNHKKAKFRKAKALAFL